MIFKSIDKDSRFILLHPEELQNCTDFPAYKSIGETFVWPRTVSSFIPMMWMVIYEYGGKVLNPKFHYIHGKIGN